MIDTGQMGEVLLYEAVLADGQSISPYVWRTKYALAHKRISYRVVPLGLTEIGRGAAGGFPTVPAISWTNRIIGDSWKIAEFLDVECSADPMLFSSTESWALAQLLDHWLQSAVMPLLFGICLLDIHNRLRVEDRAYFRKTRERRFGKTLEGFVSERETKVTQLRIALAPMRSCIERTIFLGGTNPGYADFIGTGMFLWAGGTATVALLEAGDPLIRWLDRCRDLYGGLGRALDLPGIPPAAMQ